MVHNPLKDISNEKVETQTRIPTNADCGIPESALAGVGLGGATEADIWKDVVDDSSLGGAFAAAPTGKYLTGARCIIKINKQLAGFAFQVAWRINTAQTEIWTIDSWTAHELAPQRVSIEGTIGMFHIPGKGPCATAIQPTILSFLFHKYITIEVVDGRTSELLFRTDRAVVTSRFQDIKAEQLSTIQLSWKAIGWIDEQSPALPIDRDGVTDDLLKLQGVAQLTSPF